MGFAFFSNMKTQDVILVTEKDEPIGTMEKMEVHQKGLLHRAFSVFIYNKQGKMLLQQRAPEKYHGGTLWTNACCSHPFPCEAVEKAALRRLKEELGFSTSLERIFSFTYKATVENNLIEHEYDHVFAGEFDGTISINKEEVADYCYEDMDRIKKALTEHPKKFTTWFRIVFPDIEAWWQKKYGIEVEK
jgi:isopentenyl-diphosphate delta-isomerase